MSPSPFTKTSQCHHHILPGLLKVTIMFYHYGFIDSSFLLMCHVTPSPLSHFSHVHPIFRTVNYFTQGKETIRHIFHILFSNSKTYLSQLTVIAENVCSSHNCFDVAFIEITLAM